MSDPLKQSSVNEVEFAVVGFETQGRLHVRHRCIELGLPGERNSETCMRLCIFRIELERELVLFDRFVQAAFLLQGRSVIKMWFCAHWNIRDYPMPVVALREQRGVFAKTIKRRVAKR